MIISMKERGRREELQAAESRVREYGLVKIGRIRLTENR